jgi:hypothetical protein
VPPALPALNRRRVLMGAACLTLLGATSAACGSPPAPPEVDELISQLDLARSDSQLAGAAAAFAPPAITAALTAVAAERSAHARALADEIARTATTPTPITTSATSTASASGSPPPSTQDVIAALRTSADGAGQLAARQSGYRAGLLGSIAASCTAACTVALATPAATP